MKLDQDSPIVPMSATGFLEEEVDVPVSCRPGDRSGGVCESPAWSLHITEITDCWIHFYVYRPLGAIVVNSLFI